MPATPPPPAALIEAGASEALELWTCACGLWSDYLTSLAGAVTPMAVMAVMEANTRLMAESLDLCSRAAGLRLQHAGLKAPLLADT